jgi:hypothetical protein
MLLLASDGKKSDNYSMTSSKEWSMGVRTHLIGNASETAEDIKNYLGPRILSIEGLQVYYSLLLHDQGFLFKVGLCKVIQETDIFKASETFMNSVVSPASEVLGSNAWDESFFSEQPLEQVVTRLLGNSAVSLV